MMCLVRSNLSRVAAIALVVGLYFLSRLPTLSSQERTSVAARFRFHESPLPELPGESRNVRPVHRSLEHISAWISSVGASVALNDLDGDGLANDVCYVDTRTDQVIVAPVPGTGDRFKPFVLDPGSKLFDRRTMCPTGVLPGDFNEDGLEDILVYYWGRTPLVFLRRAGTESQPPSADAYTVVDIIPTGERWYTNAATQADVDGDGHVDLLIGNYFADDAHTLDTADAGTEEMQASMSRAFNGGRKRVLLWKGATAGSNPSVSFEDVPNVFDEETAHGWALAIGACDLDGDLLPEIYFAHDFGPDRLLHNDSTPGHPKFSLLEGVRTLTTPKSKVLGHDSFKGMGVDFGDLNGDGLFDMYVSNIAGEFSLEESHFAFVNTGETEAMKRGIAPFVDQSEALGLSRSGWGWDARLVDFDNDGVPEAIQAIGFVRGNTNRWPELHETAMGSDLTLRHPSSWHRFQHGDDLSGHLHNPFYVKAADGRYYDIAADIGLGASHISRGIAIADVDGDGRLDFALANQWETSSFYHNESPHVGSFLALRLLLPSAAQSPTPTSVRDGHLPVRGARAAIGAQARLTTPDGRKLVQLVDGGNGHSGKRSPEVHFGLGATPPDAVLAVEVSWRSRTGKVERQTLKLKPGWHTVLLGSETSATAQANN